MCKVFLVRAVAKGFVFGHAASAQADDGPAGEAINVALGVRDFEIALYFERTVVVDCYFGVGHIEKNGGLVATGATTRPMKNDAFSSSISGNPLWSAGLLSTEWFCKLPVQ